MQQTAKHAGIGAGILGGVGVVALFGMQLRARAQELPPPVLAGAAALVVVALVVLRRRRSRRGY